MSDVKKIDAKAFIDKLPGRVDAAISEAVRASGCSDVLFESRMQATYEAFLDEAPESEKATIEEILIKRGYDPDFEPCEPADNECGLTGIEVDCCPCGRHP